MTEAQSHTIIAITTLLGGFSLLIISVVSNRPLTDGDMTLITMLMSAVSGWYFGTRSTLSGAKAASDAAAAAPHISAPSAAPGGTDQYA